MLVTQWLLGLVTHFDNPARFLERNVSGEKTKTNPLLFICVIFLHFQPSEAMGYYWERNLTLLTWHIICFSDYLSRRDIVESFPTVAFVHCGKISLPPWNGAIGRHQ